MSDVWAGISELLREGDLAAWLKGGLVLVIGLVLARAARHAFRRLVGPRLRAQHSMVGERAVFYLFAAIAVVAALQAAGVNLSVLLGAAGILTLALGFASQTTVSNLISGLFLVGEQTFKIGDIIRVGTTTGYVTSIDLLSVKLRTYDNVLVRLPNETLLKAEITNLSHYPIRRLDLTIGVAYKESIERVKQILLEVAEKNPYALDEPRPVFFFSSHGESAINLRFSVWFTQDKIWETTSRIQQEIHEALAAAGIEIPFPHRSLYTGSVTEPFPVRLVGEGGAPPPESA